MNTAQDLNEGRLHVSLEAPVFHGCPLAVLDTRSLPWRDERLVCMEVSKQAFLNLGSDQHTLFVIGELGDSVWITDQDESHRTWQAVDDDDPTPGFRMFECLRPWREPLHLFVQDDLDVFDRIGRKL